MESSQPGFSFVLCFEDRSRCSGLISIAEGLVIKDLLLTRAWLFPLRPPPPVCLCVNFGFLQTRFMSIVNDLLLEELQR